MPNTMNLWKGLWVTTKLCLLCVFGCMGMFLALIWVAGIVSLAPISLILLEGYWPKAIAIIFYWIPALLWVIYKIWINSYEHS